jgi:hypothetical protein
LQRPGQGRQILNSKFDFDFVGHSEIIIAETPSAPRNPEP